MGYALLPVQEGNLVKRIEIVSRRLSSLHSSTIPYFGHAFPRLVGCQFPSLLKRIMPKSFEKPRLVFSPIPISKEKGSLFNHEIIGMHGLCTNIASTKGREENVISIQHPKGILNFFIYQLVVIYLSMMGYSDTVYLSICADSGILSQEEADLVMSSWRHEAFQLNVLRHDIQQGGEFV